MILKDISDNGEVTLSVQAYDPTKTVSDTIVFASTGFRGWIMKTKGDNTVINNDAPASVLHRVYRLIVWN